MNAGQAQLEPAVCIDDRRERAEGQAARHACHVDPREHQIGGRRHDASKLVVAARMDPLPSVVARIIGKRHLEQTSVDQQLSQSASLERVGDERGESVDIRFGRQRAADANENVRLSFFDLEGRVCRL